MQMTAESLLSCEEKEKRERQRGRVRNQLFDNILKEMGGEKVSRDVQEESSHFSLNHLHVIPICSQAHRPLGCLSLDAVWRIQTEMSCQTDSVLS